MLRVNYISAIDAIARGYRQEFAALEFGYSSGVRPFLFLYKQSGCSSLIFDREPRSSKKRRNACSHQWEAKS